jgi:hypothetical protein
MSSNLVCFGEEIRRPFSAVQVGDLVTVNVYNPATGKMDQPTGATVNRISCGNVWIKVAGLTAPYPYQIGDRLVVDQNQVIDW